MTPNPSLEGTATGKALGPRACRSHLRPRVRRHGGSSLSAQTMGPMTTRVRSLVALLMVSSPLAALAAQDGAAGDEQVVTLALQERAALPDPKITVHFVGYRDDRCPSDVRCAWAGEAQAFFWVSGAGLRPRLLALPWDGAAQPDRKSQRVGAYRFYLLSLEPRPLQERSVFPTEYKAQLQIRRSAPPGATR